MRHLHWLLPTTFVVITAASHFALRFWGNSLPVEIINILSLALLPYLLSAPFLKSLGMTTGEFWVMPNASGYLLVSAICCLLLYGAGRTLQKLLSAR